MTFPTVPAYIHYCKGWDEKLKEHPVFDWMSGYELDFDVGNMKTEPYTKWHTEDYTFTKPTGETVTAGAASWATLLENYAPFSGQYHEPRFLVIWETETGYELFGQATMYANLLVEGTKTHKDLKDREWDLAVPGAFHFQFVKDPTGPKGLRMSSEKLFADGISLVLPMITRGMVTAEQVLAKQP